MKTGIYVRVSTEEQVQEGYSIRAQIQKLQDYIRIKDWEFYKVYADEGISGKNMTDRPAINELIQDIIDKKIENVLVFKVDRLTRNTKDLIELVEIFNQNDCTFNSLMESLDTQTASGRMFLKIIGIFAEFERENIVERVKVAFERKVKEGYSLCSFTPSYGYNRANGEKIQTISIEEAKIVREIFTMYVDENKSLAGIAKELNIRKVPTKKGTHWSGKTVKLILTNPNYIGKVRYACNDEKRYFETEGLHEAIITKEQFEQTQIKMSRIIHKSRKKRPSEHNYYSGTVVCGFCGRKLATHGIYRTRKDGSKYFIAQYRCVNKMLKACIAKDISHLKLDEAFRAYIDNIADFNVVDDINLEIEDFQKRSSDALRDECISDIAKLERKENEIMRLFIEEKLDFNNYSKMLAVVTKEKSCLGDKLAEIAEEEIAEDVRIGKEDIIVSIRENFDMLTKAEKLQFLQTYIERIVVQNENIENTHYGKVKVTQVDFYNK